jgi:hypothetical protein
MAGQVHLAGGRGPRRRRCVQPGDATSLHTQPSIAQQRLARVCGQQVGAAQQQVIVFRISVRHHSASRWRQPASRGLGTAVDVPLGHKDAAFVRSHFDAIEARIGDAPRAGEILVAVAVTDSGRPLPRIGGLQAHEIKGQDGLR